MSVQMKVKFSSHSVKLMKNIARLAKDTKEGIRRANYLIGRELVKDAQARILKGKKTGIIYRRRTLSGRLISHQSSAPGESPANLTGSLRQSVSFLVKGQQLIFGAGGSVVKGRLKGRDVHYARALELGDKRQNLRARPYLITTIKAEEKIIRNFYKQYIIQELKKPVT